MADENSSPKSPTPFTLEFSSCSGTQLGIGIHERQSTLRITAGENTAWKEYHGSPDTMSGLPVGRFRMAIPLEKVEKIQALVAQTRPFSLPPAEQGVPGVAILTLSVREGGSRKEVGFTSRESGHVNALRPLMTEFSAISANLNQRPVEAVQVSIRKVRDAEGERFAITIKNVGMKPVALTNPYSLGVENPVRWAGVQYAEVPPERPGVTAPPLKWMRLSLVKPQAAQQLPEILVLQPQGAFEAFTERWNPFGAKGGFQAQAFFCDYSGEPEVDKVYRIRGCAASDILELNAP